MQVVKFNFKIRFKFQLHFALAVAHDIRDQALSCCRILAPWIVKHVPKGVSTYLYITEHTVCLDKKLHAVQSSASVWNPKQYYFFLRLGFEFLWLWRTILPVFHALPVFFWIVIMYFPITIMKRKSSPLIKF